MSQSVENYCSEEESVLWVTGRLALLSGGVDVLWLAVHAYRCVCESSGDPKRAMMATRLSMSSVLHHSLTLTLGSLLLPEERLVLRETACLHDTISRQPAPADRGVRGRAV
eukprot:GHVU01163102.1.p2 GENE.GHVU01163102.1~~GHVU01163102.1.p2  ORF type:complete len:111 (-),score=0.20 GHVU01163102.1:504-836(-)